MQKDRCSSKTGQTCFPSNGYVVGVHVHVYIMCMSCDYISGAMRQRDAHMYDRSLPESGLRARPRPRGEGMRNTLRC